MTKKEFVVLANFDKPWYIRCRRDVDTCPSITKAHGSYLIEGTWFLPIYRGNERIAKSVATVMKMLSKSM
jgi:hypothetical protein